MAKTIGIRGGKSNYAGANIPDLDGVMAKLSDSHSGEKYCTMCGYMGHSARAHSRGEAVVKGEAYARDELSGGNPPPEGEHSGPAVDQRNEVEGKGVNTIAANESELTTGSKNYKLPGMREGKGNWFFG